jgi:hypothetical protein
MTEATTNEAAKKAAAEEQQKREKANKETADKLAKYRPTPTQEENDRFALGEGFPEHADDGSGPDPYATKHTEAKKPSGGYQTRQSHARE